MTHRILLGSVLVVGLVVGSSAFMLFADEPTPGIRWRTDYDAARREAHEKNLPLLLDVGTGNCVYCVKMHETTFRNARVVNVINEKFVPILMDADRDPVRARQLEVTMYPTFVLASAEGHILDKRSGYQDADQFGDLLQRILASQTGPDWMQRDFQLAQKSAESGDFARAIASLRSIMEDGRDRPLQTGARKLMEELDAKAAERLARARELQEKAQFTEAIELLNETSRLFAGSPAAKTASDQLTRILQGPELRAQQRAKRAQELLAQAQDFYKNKEYIPCLDRCEMLVASYGDLDEGMTGAQILADIRGNTEWMQNAADTMSDRLASVYLGLAENFTKRGQPQRAEYYLQRVIIAFPGSRQAESAQIRLGQLQGIPPRSVAQRP